MKPWKLELTDEEAWWLADALQQAEIRQERLAAGSRDEGLRAGWLESAERFRQLYEELLRPLVEQIEAFRAAEAAAAEPDATERER